MNSLAHKYFKEWWRLVSYELYKLYHGYMTWYFLMAVLNYGLFPHLLGLSLSVFTKVVELCSDFASSHRIMGRLCSQLQQIGLVSDIFLYVFSL